MRQTEGGVKGGALDGGQFRSAATHWTEELVQAGKWEIRFGLDTRGREHRHAPLPRRPGRVCQEPGLSHTWLTVQHQGLTTDRHAVQQRPEEALLLVAPQQGRTFISAAR